MFQAALEKHTRAECFLLYNVLYDGVVDCSNTLEDEMRWSYHRRPSYICLSENESTAFYCQRNQVPFVSVFT